MDPCVQKALSSLDGVLTSIGVDAINGNGDFRKGDIFFDHYRQYVLHKSGSVRIGIELSENGVSISIEEFSEVFEFSLDSLGGVDFSDTMKAILIRDIKIDRSGSGLSRIYAAEKGEYVLLRTMGIGIISLFASCFPRWMSKGRSTHYKSVYRDCD